MNEIRGSFLNEGYFSGKSLKLMPPDALISAYNAFGGRAVSRLAGELKPLPIPLAGFEGSCF